MNELLGNMKCAEHSTELFIHLSYANIKKFLERCKNNECKYLMSSHYNIEENLELNGIISWRFLNLEISPFNFPKPLKIIIENQQDPNLKCMALWRFSDIDLEKYNS